MTAAHAFLVPFSPQDFVKTYKRSLGAERQSVADMVARLDGGLQKLIQAAEEVDKMQVTLTEAKLVVDAKTAECNELLQVITASTAEVEEKQAAAMKQEDELSVASVQIAQDKEEAEAELAAAIPALEEAAAALNNLKKDEITEIRSFAKPHQYVQKVCECVVILRNIKDVSWKGAKVMMTDPNFLKSLLEFDKDGITDKQIKQLQTYTKDPTFTPENVVTISTAAAGLLNWVMAMIKYNAVARGVNPKRAAVAAAEKALRQAERDLIKVKAEVAQLAEQLKELSKQFEEKTAEQQDLKAKAEVMERRLNAAERLIAGLGSERTRWTADMAELAARKKRLVGDCLLTASFLSYLGGFTHDYRKAMTYETWLQDVTGRGIPLTEPFRLEARNAAPALCAPSSARNMLLRQLGNAPPAAPPDSCWLRLSSPRRSC